MFHRWLVSAKFWLTAFLIVCLSVYAIFQRKLLVYLLNQAHGQVSVVLYSKPLDELIEKQYFTEQELKKLALIQSAKRFAIDSLGYSVSQAYSTYFETFGRPLLYVLTVCPKNDLNPFQWDYPFIGRQTYKGFFDLNLLDAEKANFDTKIYDVETSEVSAWSTLGILNDPILSSMMELEDGRLVELILHELTHGEVFIASNTTFNENFANLMGRRGAKWFLNSALYEDENGIADYENYLKDKAIFYEFTRDFYLKLNQFYLESNDLNQVEISEERNRLFKEYKSQLKLLPLSFESKFLKIANENYKINNCFFASFGLYNNQLDSLDDILNESYNGNLTQFFSAIKSAY